MNRCPVSEADPTPRLRLFASSDAFAPLTALWHRLPVHAISPYLLSFFSQYPFVTFSVLALNIFFIHQLPISFPSCSPRWIKITRRLCTWFQIGYVM